MLEEYAWEAEAVQKRSGDSLFSFWMFEIQDCCLNLYITYFVHILVIFSSSPQITNLRFGSCCQGWSLAGSHVEQVISWRKHHCVRSGWLYWEQGWVTYQRRCHCRVLTFNLLMFFPSPSNGRPWQTTSHLWSLDLPLCSWVRTSELIMMFDHSVLYCTLSVTHSNWNRIKALSPRLHSHCRQKYPKSDFLSICDPYLIFSDSLNSIHQNFSNQTQTTFICGPTSDTYPSLCNCHVAFHPTFTTWKWNIHSPVLEEVERGKMNIYFCKHRVLRVMSHLLLHTRVTSVPKTVHTGVCG